MKKQYSFLVCLFLSVVFCVLLAFVSTIAALIVLAVPGNPILLLPVAAVFIAALGFYLALNDF